jgi:hypothetical protein
MQDVLNHQAREPRSAITRRAFFQRMGAVIVGSALFLGGRFAPAAHAAPQIESPRRGARTAPTDAPDIRSPLERSVFAAHLGETFRVQASTLGVIPLELFAVHAPVQLSARTRPDEHTFENCFSIGFRGTRSIPQGTYTFSHPQMGSFPLFIVPMTQDDTSFTYQAVFHRLPA